MFRRLIESRLRDARRVANELVDGLDDRGRLFVLELAAEQKRITGLAMVAFATVVVVVVTLVWAAATVVALAWDTEWRTTALVGMLAFWVVSSLILALRLRALLASMDQAFRLSRQVAAEDVARLREVLGS